MSSRAGGFTLIEVLVALAIVTIGMAAVLEALTSSARTAMYLQNKTFAEWVALDQMENTRLTGTLPKLGITTGKLEMARRSWEWRQTVANSQVPGVLRISVDVRPAGSKGHHNWYAGVIGVVGNALAPPPPPGVSEPAWMPGLINGAGLPAAAPGALNGPQAPAVNPQPP